MLFLEKGVFLGYLLLRLLALVEEFLFLFLLGDDAEFDFNLLCVFLFEEGVCF